MPLNDKTISKVANIFNRLDGKQVWHITAPAGVSLKDLKQFSLNKAMGGEAILNQNGADYGLSKSAKGEDGMREVVVPRSDGYKAGMSCPWASVAYMLANFGKSLRESYIRCIYRRPYVCPNWSQNTRIKRRLQKRRSR